MSQEMNPVPDKRARSDRDEKQHAQKEARETPPFMKPEIPVRHHQP